MRSDPRSADRALMAAAVLAMAFLLGQLLDFGYGRDQGIFAAVGQTIRDGGVPYRDAWDFKPPGVYFVYALAGPWMWGIRVLEAAALIALVMAFARLSRRYLDDSRPGIIGGAIAILTHVKLEFWHTGQPESFGAAFIAWGLVYASDAMSRSSAVTSSRRSWWWAVSGACFGTAALFKPTVGIAGLASLGLGVIAPPFDEPESPKRVSGIVMPFGLGAAAPALLCIGYFALHRGLTGLWSALFEFAPYYAGLAWQQAGALELFVRLVRGWLVDYSMLNVVGLLLLCLLTPTRTARRGLVLVGAAIALLLIGVMAQARLFAYHFGAVLPLTALIAGWGFWQLWLRCRSAWSAALVYVALFALIGSYPSAATTEFTDTFAERCWFRLEAWVRQDNRTLIRDRLYSQLDYPADENRQAASWIAREVDPRSTVLIYGFTPEIYVAARRQPASRYIYNSAQRASWSRATARDELVADLAKSPPSVVLVEHHDVFPWVTGTLDDSAADLATFTSLQSILTSRYRQVQSIGRFDVYRRSDGG